MVADDQTMAAMTDRLAHHEYLLVFKGEIYCMKHALPMLPPVHNSPFLQRVMLSPTHT